MNYDYEFIENYYKNIKVFISSTFIDMKKERDVIAESLRKEIKTWKNDVGYDLDIIDMRWGITREDGYRGRTVPLCLRAVNHSLPFFIGLVGNKKGWMPQFDDLNRNIQSMITNEDRFKQFLCDNEIKRSITIIKENIGKSSITEMEIYAAIQNPESLFLLKKNANDEEDENVDLKNLLLDKCKNVFYYDSVVDVNGEIKFYVNGISMGYFVFTYMQKMMILKSNQDFIDCYDKKLFLQDCYQYGKYLHYNCLNTDFEDEVDQFFVGDESFYYVEGSNYAVENAFCVMYKYIHGSYEGCKVVLSFNELTYSTLKYRIAIQNIDLEKDYLVIIAKSFSPEVIELIKQSDSKKGICMFNEKADISLILTLPKLTETEIFNYIESIMIDYAKYIPPHIIEALSKKEELRKYEQLISFIDDIINMTDYLEVEERLKQITGLEYDERKIENKAEDSGIPQWDLIKPLIRRNNILYEKMISNEKISEDDFNEFESIYNAICFIPDWSAEKKGVVAMNKSRFANLTLYNYVNAIFIYLYQQYSMGLQEDYFYSSVFMPMVEKIICTIERIDDDDLWLKEYLLKDFYHNPNDEEYIKKGLVCNNYSYSDDFRRRTTYDQRKIISSRINFDENEKFKVVMKWEYLADQTIKENGEIEYSNVKANPSLVKTKKYKLRFVHDELVYVFNFSAMEFCLKMTGDRFLENWPTRSLSSLYF